MSDNTIELKNKIISKFKKGQITESKIPKTGINKYSLSFSQNRLWYLEQLFPDTAAYNMYIAWKFEHPLDLNILAKTITELVATHPALRTYIENTDNGAFQVVLPDTEISIKEYSAKSIEEASKLAEKISAIPFNLCSPPLFRTHIIDCESGESILLFVMHHIISDGWSLKILSENFSDIYNALNNNTFKNRSEDKAVSYIDFVMWQRNLITQSKFEKQILFWKNMLSKSSQHINLEEKNTLKANPSSNAGERFTFNLGEKLSKKIEYVCRKNRTTPYMALLAAFVSVMHRHTNQYDFTVGSPIAGRNHNDLNDTVGMFANTLPIRILLEQNMTLKEILAHVKKICLSCYENQDLPFEHIVKTIQPNRDINSSPLFNLAFVYQSIPFLCPKIENNNASQLFIHNKTCKFNLLLTMTKVNGEIVGAFEYDTSLYKNETISLIAKHLIHVCQYLDNDDYNLSNFPLMEKYTPIENKAASFDHESSVLKELDNISKNNNKIALKFESSEISYSNLISRSNTIANYLIQEKGVSRGMKIGLCLYPSIDLIVSIIAILKSGCSYIPLDPSMPEDRLEYIIDDSKASLILGNSNTNFIKQKSKIEFFDIASEEVKNYTYIINRVSYPHPEETAYIIYTSGSTGKPKGVMVSHGNLFSLLSNCKKIYSFSSSDVWLLFHSFSFDFSIWEIWGALFFGGKLIVLSEDEKKDPSLLYKSIVENNVSILNQTPMAFKQLANYQKLTDQRLTSLKYVIFGGDKLNLEDLSYWFSIYPDNKTQLYNMYGITETTVHVTYRRITKEDIYLSFSPIGKAIPGLCLFLLDTETKPAPNGVVGEIYIGGTGVSKGYLYKDDLTESRFLESPWIHNMKLYKSGDLARIRTDGELEYIGRSDNQIKIRGHRIELDEIRKNIVSHPFIDNCLTRLVPGEEKEKDKIVSFILFDDKTISSYREHHKAKEQMDKWNIVFDEYYHQKETTDTKKLNLNTTGWIDSYSRKLISNDKMLEWVNNTVDRILSIGAKNILEIGCGTGMLLSRIAPHSSQYIGCDLSEEALSYVQKNLIDLNKNLSHVTLSHQHASEIQLGDNSGIELIILNSICQYFPDIDYFFKVLENSLSLLSDEGAVFLGDIRNLDTCHYFYSSVAISHAENETKILDTRNLFKKMNRKNNELCLSPLFFHSLKNKYNRIKNVVILYKDGIHNTEMNNYRYDVMLFLDSDTTKPETFIANVDSIEDIKSLIQEKNTFSAFRFKDIANYKIYTHVEMYRKLLSHDEEEKTLNIVNTKEGPSLSKTELEKLSKSVNMKVFLSPSLEHPEKIDVVFCDSKLKIKFIPTQDETTTNISDKVTFNNPTASIFYQHWISEIKNYIRTKIPEYMIPSQFIEIDKVPLTINGKTDESKLLLMCQNKKNRTRKYTPPKTKTEKIISDVFSEILSTELISRFDNFFELGGHSMLATQAIFKMRDIFKNDLPLRILLLNPKVNMLAKAIDLYNSGNSDHDLINEKIDVESESLLSPDIVVPKDMILSKEKNCLLTGCTGFVGSFLLYSLIKWTDNTVYCLVRSQNDNHARERIMESLSKYNLLKDLDTNRIVAISGNLESSNLSITEKKYNHLAKKIGVIYHNAAEVNFSYPYSLLKKSNVLGTEHIIKLASTFSLKKVHFISTLFVFAESDSINKSPIHEDQIPMHFNELSLGYTQTKWICEKKIIAARKLGIPINIFRLGRIGGHSITGYCQNKDFFWETIRLGLKMKCLPDTGSTIDILPVDLACNSIVALAQNNYINHQFHIANPEKIEQKDFISILKNMGYQFSEHPMDTWKEKLSKILQEGDISDEDKNLIGLILSIAKKNKIDFSIDMTMKMLGGLTKPPTKLSLMKNCQWFIDNLYFEQPDYFKEQSNINIIHSNINEFTSFLSDLSSKIYKNKKPTLYVLNYNTNSNTQLSNFIRNEFNSFLEKLFSYNYTILPNKIPMNHLFQYETDYLFEEIFIEKTYLKRNIQLKKNACVIDVGANIGMFSLFIKQVCPSANIYAFEPISSTFNILKNNFAIHNIGTPINSGIAGKDGDQKFTRYINSTVFSGKYADKTSDFTKIKNISRNMIERTYSELESDELDAFTSLLTKNRDESCEETVTTINLNSFIEKQNLERIDLLKVDAEGCEKEIISSLTDSSWSKIDQIVIEVHLSETNTIDYFIERLEEKGFSVSYEEEELLKNTSFINLYATKYNNLEATADSSLPENYSRHQASPFELGLIQYSIEGKSPLYIILKEENTELPPDDMLIQKIRNRIIHQHVAGNLFIDHICEEDSTS